jgi:hypothetical protein
MNNLMSSEGTFEAVLYSNFPNKIYVEVTFNSKFYISHQVISVVFMTRKLFLAVQILRLLIVQNYPDLSNLVQLKAIHKTMLWNYTAFFLFNLQPNVS